MVDFEFSFVVVRLVLSLKGDHRSIAWIQGVTFAIVMNMKKCCRIIDGSQVGKMDSRHTQLCYVYVIVGQLLNTY